MRLTLLNDVWVANHSEQFWKFLLYRFWIITQIITEYSKQTSITVPSRPKNLIFHVSYVQIETILQPKKAFSEMREIKFTKTVSKIDGKFMLPPTGKNYLISNRTLKFSYIRIWWIWINNLHPVYAIRLRHLVCWQLECFDDYGVQTFYTLSLAIWIRRWYRRELYCRSPSGWTI